MADDFDAGICSGSWWNTTKMIGSGGAMGAAAVSCSSAINDTSGSSSSSSTGAAFSWLSTADHVVEPTAGISSASLPFSGFGGLWHAPPINWNNQTLLSSSTDQRETSFHNDMLQEPLLTYDHRFHMSPQEINHHQQQQQFLMPQQQQQQQSGFPVMLQGLYNLEPKPQPPPAGSSSFLMGNKYHQASPTNEPLLEYSSPLKQQQQQQQQSNSSISANHLQFSNNAPFWNPSAAAVIGEAKSGNNIYPSSLQQFVTQSFEQKPNCSSITATTKSNTDASLKKSSSSSSCSEASLKKPRTDKPSPLPALKVRKEKLGDRITALQQLVSPFGKTDTASVLHEAIQYIKFLHDQVNMLSTPYLKNGNPMQHQQSSDKSKDGEGTKQDLRSRGLCLVPMESIYPVASETMADIWTPTFGGTYR